MGSGDEPRKIVSRRSAITGGKYFTRGQERIMAVPDSYAEPKKLPPVEKPAAIRARLWSFIQFDLTEADAQAWAEADEEQRDTIMREFYEREIETAELESFLTGDVDELTCDDLEQERIRSEASYLGIEPKQFVWLEERLSDEEFSQLGDDEMHRLLAEEYPGR